jgi:hypothetical protein
MENLRKKNQTEIMEIKSPFSQTKNSPESHSSRLEQVEDRISELKDKIEIKGKTEDMLVKQFKSCERTMQELTDSIKRPNLRIMGIKECKEIHAKGIHNIFLKISDFPPCQAPAQCETALSLPCWDPCPLAAPDPALCWIHALPVSLPHGTPASQALPGPSSIWDDQIHALPGSPPLGLHRASALQDCQITAPPGSCSGHHRSSPILPKRLR